MEVKHPQGRRRPGSKPGSGTRPSFWTHRPIPRRIISPPTSREGIPPPPTTHRDCDPPAAHGSPMNRSHLPCDEAVIKPPEAGDLRTRGQTSPRTRQKDHHHPSARPRAGPSKNRPPPIRHKTPTQPHHHPPRPNQPLPAKHFVSSWVWWGFSVLGRDDESYGSAGEVGCWAAVAGDADGVGGRAGSGVVAVGGASMWCVKRWWVVSWLVGGCGGCCCGSWCEGSGCGGGSGRGRLGPRRLPWSRLRWW